MTVQTSLTNVMGCGFRDGSAVELVGLCKSVVHWLCDLNSRGVYKNKGVMVQFGNKSKTSMDVHGLKKWSHDIVVFAIGCLFHHRSMYSPIHPSVQPSIQPSCVGVT